MLAPFGAECPLTEQLGKSYAVFQKSARLPKRLAVKASPPLLILPHEKWRSAKVKVLIILKTAFSLLQVA
jgi:hypothetical protein